jgi:hypothetical protein
MPSAFTRLDSTRDEADPDPASPPPRGLRTSSAEEETTPLSLSALEGSFDESLDDSSTLEDPWSPDGRVASPLVVRSGDSSGGLICVDPRWWSRAMVLVGVMLLALLGVDVILIYLQASEDIRFMGSDLMWTSVGFGLGLCVCCGLCVATHGGAGLISLILRDERMDTSRR